MFTTTSYLSKALPFLSWALPTSAFETLFCPSSSASLFVPFVSCIISGTEAPRLHWIIWLLFLCRERLFSAIQYFWTGSPKSPFCCPSRFFLSHSCSRTAALVSMFLNCSFKLPFFHLNTTPFCPVFLIFRAVGTFSHYAENCCFILSYRSLHIRAPKTESVCSSR